MNSSSSTILLLLFGVVLLGHYLSQKALLAKGWKSENSKPQIKRLTLNGLAMFVLALAALATAEFPYGLIGILLLIEAAVGLAFAKKLRNK